MQNTKITSNSIFVFDLHGVIFKLSLFQVIKEIINSPNKLKLFQTLAYPKAIISTYLSLKKGAIAEEVLLNLSKDFPQFEGLVPLGFKIINAQKPVTKTVDIIEQLKKDGHKLYIFSNIGEQSIEILRNKFPEIFAHFDNIIHSTKEDNYLKKPNPKAFEKFLNHLNPENTSKIFFIDDKKTNIDAAHQFGMNGILFKNPKHLQKTILSLN